MTWQPISTAPKDGTEIIAFRPDQGVFVCRWGTLEEFVPKDMNGDPMVDYDEDFAHWWHDRWGWMEGSDAPTHWQPLPKPPTEDALLSPPHRSPPMPSDAELRALAERLVLVDLKSWVGALPESPNGGDKLAEAAAFAILGLLEERDKARAQARESAASAVSAYGQAEENSLRATLAETRLARAVEALRPFAELADKADPDDGNMMAEITHAAAGEFVTLGECRRAASILSEITEAKDE